MESFAIAKMQRIAPRKVRIVLDLVRGKKIKEARALLMFTPKAASPIILKVLNSAVANAVNNNKQKEEALYIKTCFASEGQTLKRMQPRSKGSASPIMKRTSHITVILDTKE
ncbi:MAG: 50S ribosomal protein L22 [Acholeplasmatales bacterium]|jgi:large subunit ribosomal protein L22|nr:50S ribosomal protein L22 [Acholeplasmatales bacterium]